MLFWMRSGSRASLHPRSNFYVIFSVFLQDILKKLDIGKIKDDDTDPTKKKKQLLNYE